MKPTRGADVDQAMDETATKNKQKKERETNKTNTDTLAEHLESWFAVVVFTRASSHAVAVAVAVAVPLELPVLEYRCLWRLNVLALAINISITCLLPNYAWWSRTGTHVLVLVGI